MENYQKNRIYSPIEINEAEARTREILLMSPIEDQTNCYRLIEGLCLNRTKLEYVVALNLMNNFLSQTMGEQNEEERKEIKTLLKKIEKRTKKLDLVQAINM